MASVINTNIPSLNAQRNLSASQTSLSTSIQRLSTGLRVNSAKDDAAGLAIAERMNAQVRGLNVAARNANDGVSLAQTAEGALGKIGDMVQRIRELAVQSSNATNSDDDRLSLQKEVDQLKEEINRVAGSSNFNGKKLLDGSLQNAVFQVGADAGENIQINAVMDATLTGMGGVKHATVESDEEFAGGPYDAVAATDFQITVGGVATGIALAAATTTAERQAQVVAGINKVSTQTGVGAYLDTANNKIVLTGESDFTITATDADQVGFTGGDVEAIELANMSDIKITNYADSQLAIRQADAALKEVNSTRAMLGAIQSRFENAVSNIQIASENTAAARSRIMDADFAAETASMTRAQILQQAGTAMLSQANQLPQQVLSLLR